MELSSRGASTGSGSNQEGNQVRPDTNMQS